MYRIIGGDGREYGPVSALQIEQWIAQNRANGSTRVRADSATDWRPLNELPEFATALAARCAPPPLPGADNTPAAPAEPAAVASPAPTAEEAVAGVPADNADRAAEARAIAGRSYGLSVFETLSRGWSIIVSNFWLTVGATTLLVLLTGLLSAIPVAGIAITFGLNLVFIAGAYRIMVGVARGEPAGAGDLFAGFGRPFRRLLALTFVSALATRVLALLALGPLLWQLHTNGSLDSAELSRIALGGDPFSELFVLSAEKGLLSAIGAHAGALLAMPVLMIPLLYVSVAWTFAPILVIDRGLGPVEALVLSRRAVGRRWFRLFFLHLAFFPLAIAGLLCFGVGIFVVAALALASFTAAYEQAFAASRPRGRPERD
ncbi:MAG: GYF domain-containing protein [Opitutaceae bacterium]